MLLFSQVVWSGDSWWFFITHSARSHCIIDYLASIVYQRGLTPPPQTQTSCIREPTGREKYLLVTLREQRLNPVTASPRTWSERRCRASQRDWGRNYQGSLQEGVKEKLEPFWHIAAFCTITLPTVFRLWAEHLLQWAGTLSCSSFSFKTQTHMPCDKCFTNVCRKLAPSVSHFLLW